MFSDFCVRDSASFATFTDQAIFEQPIERVIEFRQRVREEFDRLVCESEKRLIAPSCENAIIIPEGNDAKGESRGLEDLFERPQISGQTGMPHLMERKSTRRVEKAGEAQA